MAGPDDPKPVLRRHRWQRECDRSLSMLYRHRLRCRTSGHGRPGRTIRSPYCVAMDGSGNANEVYRCSSGIGCGVDRPARGGRAGRSEVGPASPWMAAAMRPKSIDAYRHRLRCRTPGHGRPGRTIRSRYCVAMDGSGNATEVYRCLSASAAVSNARPGAAGPDDPKSVLRRHGWQRQCDRSLSMPYRHRLRRRTPGQNGRRVTGITASPPCPRNPRPCRRPARSSPAAPPAARSRPGPPPRRRAGRCARSPA